MKSEKDNFIIGRIKSVKYAVKGLYLLVTTEHSIMAQLFIAVLLCCLGFYFEIDANQWMFQTIGLGLLLVAESLNTAIEKTLDFIHPYYHKKIGFIKDISAGASVFAAIVLLVIVCVIYIPIVF
ncbi:MAG: diacylglycerol kinase family protein [Flavobacteriaceae bacterium]|nr:diacylglycerol kinase family protein [Flavobacteriaceae bacterium]